MSEMKHTPGPWFWSGNDLMASRGDGSSEHVLLLDPRPVLRPSNADRALVEAAPKLLEALKGLTVAYAATPGAATHNGSWYSHAIAAITQAEGTET